MNIFKINVLLSSLFFALPLLSMQDKNQEMMRLWVGVDVPPWHIDKPLLYQCIQKRIKETVTDLKFDGGFHVTVLFIGNTPASKLNSVQEALSLAVKDFKEKIGSEKIRVTTERKFTFFENAGALVLKVHAHEAFIALREAIDKQLEDHKIDFSKQYKFNPHVTIGKSLTLKPEQIESYNTEITNALESAVDTFDIDEIILYQSLNGTFIPHVKIAL